MNPKRANADLTVAEHLLSPHGNPTNDEYIHDIAAYHTQQAIEKNLKYILHDIFGEDDTTKSFRTHNIASLILKVEKHGFLIDDALKEMSADITQWEAGTRYTGDIVATLKDIKIAIGLCKELNEQIICYQNSVEKPELCVKENNGEKSLFAQIMDGDYVTKYRSSHKDELDIEL